MDVMKYCFKTSEFVYINDKGSGFYIFDKRNHFGFPVISYEIPVVFDEYLSWSTYFVPFDKKIDMNYDRIRWARSTTFKGTVNIFYGFWFELEEDLTLFRLRW